MRVFALQRFVNMARLIREICQHEKPLANEITEPPAFTVSNQELRGKAKVLVTFSARTLFGVVINRENKTDKAILGKKKEEIEEQVPTRDCKEALVNDMKSLGKKNPGLCSEVALL